MMKFAFALVAVLALASPLQAYNVPRTGSGVLANEIQEFVDLVPTKEIMNIVLRYIATDVDVQAVLKFVHSAEFKQLVIEIEAMSEIRNIMNYIQTNGLDIYQIVNHINKYLDLDSLVPPTNVRMVRAAGGIRGMLDEVKALVPKEKIRELYRTKMASSKVFADLVAQLKSPEFQNVANQLCNNATFKHVLVEAKKAQVDIDGLARLLETVLGLTLPCKPMKFSLVALSAMVAFATVNCYHLPAFGEGPLYEDIQYFIDMIPMDEVMRVIVQYTVKDSEFQQLLKYMKTDDCKQMVNEIEAIPEFRTFASYMDKHGIYMYDALNKMNKVIGLPSFQPILVKKEITGGLTGLFNDVKELISYDDIIHGYVYKMRTSQDFRDFVAELKSEGHQNFVNALYKNQRYLAFRATLVSKGLDITLIEDVIYTVLGIEFPVLDTTNALYDNQLSKDIQDFIDLIDMDKVIKIISNYLDDDQIQESLRYFRSEEFHVLVRKVEALKPYQNLVQYLHNAGLNIHGLIQKIHKLFGMEDYVPPSGNYFSFFVNRGGMKGLIDDILASLPVDKFKAMFEEKMKTSPDFQNFVKQVQSKEFEEIIDTVYSEPIFLEMRQKAIDIGLDIQRARQLFEEIGILLPRPSY
ncbi:uncharacterized protein LOC117604709 [Osmia lignaria lignaria]|uniref:uncharacterized protein LOC117604709 n=1 Tax=Osmia lignaria lignaria TaxID=1437193 RepID=UPI001478E997|nr:uncharacterized protein LOC117604709 [Osmia lignaria]